MANLVSPGVSVTVTDESFFIPASATTVPLIFLATAAEKTQPDGVSAAAGTYEHNVIRTVTSLRQSTELFGVPRFMETAGEQHHGDARNEYGLFALNQFLGIGNLAYTIRANVNLNDNLDFLRDVWDTKMTEASYVLENLVNQYLNDYNALNNLTISDVGLINGTGTLVTGFGYTVGNYTNVALTGGNGTNATANIAVTNGVDTVTISNAGTGYTDGAHTGIALTGSASGTGAIASITVTGGVVTNVTITNNGSGGFLTGETLTGTVPGGSGFECTVATLTGVVSSVTIVAPGNGYEVGDTLSATVPGGSGFSITVTAILSAKTTVDKTILSGLIDTATELLWDFSSFAPVQNDFLNDHTSNPLLVYANGYTSAATGTFDGMAGVLDEWESSSSGSVIGTEWTAEEAGDTLVGAGDDFKFTSEFLNKTSLGVNDAARRLAIVTALQATINSNTDIRGEQYEYNLILCPGYHETVDELLNLCIDIQEEAFVIGEVPLDMDPTEVVSWAATTGRRTSRNVAYYYPHAIASNLDGTNVYVGASGVALRTMAYSDEVSELWFAPAGTRRGLVSGISQVGYIDGVLGQPTTFTEVALNQGQRDNLYTYFTNINPIVFFPGRGIIVWGQKTSAPDASAMDRINVTRLVAYIKRSLRKNTMSFVFEPNDQLTRDSLKATVDNFLGDLIVKRGLYDYATVCDESNNTPDRIDRNEMYIDIALKPVKAAEFIYIPIRIVATGAEI